MVKLTEYLLAEVPEYERYFGVDEMALRSTELIESFPGIARRQNVGTSQDGTPIDVLTIGSGPLSVLIVGAPHPHEMTGTLSIDFLLSYLCRDAEYLKSSGFTWHFIKAIEPSGVRVNEPWFRTPCDLEYYFSSFFRPALADQAEYTFPFEKNGAAFTRSIPEMQAWRAALHLTRPQLLCSLHNCEAGGAFFVTSELSGELDQELMASAIRLGFPLGESGEAGSQFKPGTRGIFPFKDEVERSISEAHKFGIPQNSHTGDSSAGYAQREFGTFSMIPEVPMWRVISPEEHEQSAQVNSQTNEWTTKAVSLINQYLPTLKTTPGSTAFRLIRSLTELLDELDCPSNVGAEGGIPEQLFLLRGPAMLMKLAGIASADSSNSEAIEVLNQCHSHLTACCAMLRNKLVAIPLRRQVQLQVAAIDLSVQYLHQNPSVGRK